MITTKERCLEALKDNEFFQSAMKANKMILVTHQYEPWIVISDFMFGNQYNAINSEGKKRKSLRLCFMLYIQRQTS